MIPIAVERGYRHCERVTRAEAANFYYGIRLLPRSRRRALCAIYALARRIDDVADGDLPAREKLLQLTRARADLSELDGLSADPVLVALADARLHYPIPLDAFVELVEGAELDVRGTRYETFDDLCHYCRCVAGSIGRLTLGVLDVRDRAAAEPRALELGIALQLTNILRDVREDAARGRFYLPAEDLARFGCTLNGDLEGPVTDLIAFEATRAREWLDRGLRLLPLLDRQGAACVGTMAGIYGRLLARIQREPAIVLGNERLSLAGWEKGWVVVRSLTAGAL